MNKITELPEELKNKLEELMKEWSDLYLDGKPAILATAIYYNVESLLIEKTNEVLEKF